jgi:hypothetical protein
VIAGREPLHNRHTGVRFLALRFLSPRVGGG